MAKIEMDISEYDSMRENKKLLEESLKREQELFKKIEDTQKEKIQALEDAKMKVVKINKKVIEEHALTREQNSSVIREIAHLFGIDSRYIRSVHSYDLNRLCDMLFTKTKSISESNIETEVIGLDEIKIQLREDIKSKIDADIQRKLKDSEIIQQNLIHIENYFKSLSDDYTNLQSNNNNIIEQNNKLLEENKTLNDKISEQEIKLKEYEAFSNKIPAVQDILDQEINFWNRSAVIQQLKMLFNKK